MWGKANIVASKEEYNQKSLRRAWIDNALVRYDRGEATGALASKFVYIGLWRFHIEDYSMILLTDLTQQKVIMKNGLHA